MTSEQISDQNLIEMRNRHLTSIFDLKEKVKEATTVLYEHEEGRMAVISTGNASIPPEIQKALLLYQKQKGFRRKGNIGRGDCQYVAAQLSYDASRIPQFKNFICTSKHMIFSSGEQSFFRELSFSHHYVNFLERTDETDSSLTIIIDLTTPYNIDADQGQIDLLAVVAPDYSSAVRLNKKITGLEVR